MPTVDRFLSHLGDPGRYQVIIMILLAANVIPVVVNHLLMAFYAVPAPFNCKVRKSSKVACLIQLLFVPENLNVVIQSR